MWLQPSRRDSQWVKYLKLVILKIPNVWFGSVFLKPITDYVCKLCIDPVKPQRFTTEPACVVRELHYDVCGAKLLPMTVSAYFVDNVCFCHSQKTKNCCKYSIGRYNCLHCPLSSIPLSTPCTRIPPNCPFI